MNQSLLYIQYPLYNTHDGGGSELDSSTNVSKSVNIVIRRRFLELVRLNIALERRKKQVQWKKEIKIH